MAVVDESLSEHRTRLCPTSKAGGMAPKLGQHNCQRASQSPAARPQRIFTGYGGLGLPSVPSSPPATTTPPTYHSSGCPGIGRAWPPQHKGIPSGARRGFEPAGPSHGSWAWPERPIASPAFQEAPPAGREPPPPAPRHPPFPRAAAPGGPARIDGTASGPAPAIRAIEGGRGRVTSARNAPAPAPGGHDDAAPLHRCFPFFLDVDSDPRAPGGQGWRAEEAEAGGRGPPAALAAQPDGRRAVPSGGQAPARHGRIQT